MARKTFKALTDETTATLVEELETSNGGNLTSVIAQHLDDPTYDADEPIKEYPASVKLEKKEAESPGLNRVSCILSDKALANLRKYSEQYGYRKLNPFINDLFEHIDAYL